MERVYKNTDEIMDYLNVVPVFDNSGLRLDLYLDGRKVGRIDKHTKEIELNVKVAGEGNKSILNDYTDNESFSATDAFYHYFTGSGSAVTVDFAEIDIGLQPSDFPNYQNLVRSMYRKHGTLKVDEKTSRDIGGWAGHITYRLKGTIMSNKYEWKFSGYIGAYDDKFDFDARSWGERAYWAEVVTMMLGVLPAGTPYAIRFEGNRAVTDGETW